MLTHSTAESERFGFKVMRAKFAEVPAPGALRDMILAEGADLVILRASADKRKELGMLSGAGFPSIVADTLVYYGVDLHRHSPAALRNSDLEFVRVDASLVPELSRLIDMSFCSYTNHYDANAFLKRSDFLAGYKEWAVGFGEHRGDERAAWVARRGGEAIAFCTCAWDRDARSADAVLYGVLPTAAGGGIYGDLIRFTQRHYLEAGCSRMRISTQVENFAVQKVWAREGFVMDEALVTIHINSFLRHSVLPAVERPFSPIDEQGSSPESGSSGVGNGDAASLAEMQRFFCTEFPGPGTVCLNLHASFFVPLQSGQAYTIRYSFPSFDRESGAYHAVTQIRDTSQRLCAISYSDLLKR
ncbi:MAG: GNAT family N-acetyltransferase [Deltaproteobacteria bacterium]|nr:GNAT family N-acetyltransferase [Deltaproteobacteria bacterium]